MHVDEDGNITYGTPLITKEQALELLDMKPMSPEHEEMLLKSVDEAVETARKGEIMPLYLNEEANALVTEAIANSDATTLSEVIIGTHNLIQKVLLPKIEKLERVREAAKDIYGGGDTWHGEDCPGETYDLPEGEIPGECECGANAIRAALKACDEPSSRATGIEE